MTEENNTIEEVSEVTEVAEVETHETGDTKNELQKRVNDNQIINVNYETGEISTLTRIDDRNIMIKDPVTQKFAKKRIFPAFSTIIPETQEEKVAYYKKFVENDDVLVMSEHEDETFNVVGVIRDPYEQIDEDTGMFSYGVTVKLLTDDDQVLATSSKAVAIKTEEYEKILGLPSIENPWIVKVVKKKSEVSKYKYIDLVLA